MMITLDHYWTNELMDTRPVPTRNDLMDRHEAEELLEELVELFEDANTNEEV